MRRRNSSWYKVPGVFAIELSSLTKYDSVYWTHQFPLKKKKIAEAISATDLKFFSWTRLFLSFQMLYSVHPKILSWAIERLPKTQISHSVHSTTWFCTISFRSTNSQISCDTRDPRNTWIKSSVPFPHMEHMASTIILLRNRLALMGISYLRFSK